MNKIYNLIITNITKNAIKLQVILVLSIYLCSDKVDDSPPGKNMLKNSLILENFLVRVVKLLFLLDKTLSMWYDLSNIGCIKLIKE